MTKLSLSLIAAGAALTALSLGNTPAFADVADRDTENRGGMLGGVQTPSVSSKGSFVHRGKAIVWVPNEARESDPPQRRASRKPSAVVGREVGEAQPRVRAATSRGAFIQNGKITSWISNEDLAERLRSGTLTGRPFNPNGRVVLLGGAEVHRDLLADLSGDYVLDRGAPTQPPTVTSGGAFVHEGKSIRWVPGANPEPMLGQ